jgi:hypothetical protein
MDLWDRDYSSSESDDHKRVYTKAGTLGESMVEKKSPKKKKSILVKTLHTKPSDSGIRQQIGGGNAVNVGFMRSGHGVTEDERNIIDQIKSKSN